ncbi:phosphodiester glycosidase family protein [Paenibacillus chungangensis]|uniref:N-acetylmuramoyl-L-alanine amidase n=1 Tax=Paenibacillus chungangensis TaxID=696535 RepID=A0ABW3HQF7_9BACL
MIAHKRIRIAEGKLEEGPLQYPVTGIYSKQQGWTDMRVAEIPPEAVIRTELVVAKGKTVSAILDQLVRKHSGHWLVCNASFFNAESGALLGRTYRNGKVIFPDIAGKTEYRPHLFYRNNAFMIARQNSPSNISWGVSCTPMLTSNGCVNLTPDLAEQTPYYLLSSNPRTIAGVKSDGTLSLILIDGRGKYDKGFTTAEAGVMAANYGYREAVNLDGGGSSTLATNNQELLAALGIDRSNKKRCYHVADMSRNYKERVVHHAIAIQFRPDKLLPNYRVNHIPRNTPYNRRPGHRLEATTITIHNTGNAASTARNELNWLTNPRNKATASYHLVVDERETIECIPLHETAWHAGDGNREGSGNRTSIAIELCESGNYEHTLIRASRLVADLLRERGWGVDRLRRHYDWSGKICPRLMYASGSWSHWDKFKQQVAANL